MSETTVYFEVSFDGPDELTRTALAHSEDQARELAVDFRSDGLNNVVAYRVTTTRERFDA